MFLSIIVPNLSTEDIDAVSEGAASMERSSNIQRWQIFPLVLIKVVNTDLCESDPLDRATTHEDEVVFEVAQGRSFPCELNRPSHLYLIVHLPIVEEPATISLRLRALKLEKVGINLH